MLNHQKPLYRTALAFAAICVTAPAASQIEEVIVTAQKRAQNLQEIPITVSAFGAEDLKNAGAQSLDQLTEFVVGAELYDDRGAGQPTWVIRGVGLADFNANNTPTAAIYYDEFYLGSNAYGGIGLYDIERVEILKGPQGGLYGRNTSGGAVRVVSTPPDTESGFSGSLTAARDRWDKSVLQASMNFSISDNLALRIAANRERGGGWQDTLATPDDDEFGDRDAWAVKATTLFTPDGQSEWLLKIELGRDRSETPLVYGRAMYQEDQLFCEAALRGEFDPQTCLTWYNATVFGTSGGTDTGIDPARQKRDGTVVLSQPINQLDNEFTAVNLQYRREFESFLLTSISALIEYDYLQLYDYDGSPLTLGTEDSIAELRSWSQEIRIQSLDSDRLDWLFGAMLGRDTDTESRKFDARENTFVLPISAFRGFKQASDSWSVYAQGAYQVADAWQIHGSLRYTVEDKKLSEAFFRKGEISALPPSTPAALLDIANAAIGDATGLEDYDGVSHEIGLDKRWSGDLGVNYLPVEDIMLFAKVTSGFKSGGFFGGFALDKKMLEPYREESVLALEIGVKSTLLNRTLRVNASAFYYDYQDIQGYDQQLNESTDTVLTSLTNIGDGDYQGAELELQWRPAAIPGIELAAGFSWLDAVVADSDAVAASSDGETVPLEGIRVPLSAEYSYMVSASYERPVTRGMLISANAIYSWRDATFDETTALGLVDVAGFGIDEYGLLNARLALMAPEAGWELFLSGNNLNGKDYWTVATTDGLGSFTSTAGRPPTWNVGFSYTW